MSELFLSNETNIHISHSLLTGSQRWLPIPHTGIVRPALVLAAGEIACLPPIELLIGEQVAWRCCAAHDHLQHDAVLALELEIDGKVHELVRMTVPTGPHGLSPREATLDLSAWAGNTGSLRLHAVGENPRIWIAVHDLSVGTPSRQGLLHARAFRSDRTSNEIAHFANVYDHAMYQVVDEPASLQQPRCQSLADLVAASTRHDESSAPPTQHPLPDEIEPGPTNPYEYAHHLLGLKLRAQAPDFVQRLAALAERRSRPDRPLRILSLCAGAARIESQFARSAGIPTQWTLLDISDGLLARAHRNFNDLPPPRLLLADVNEVMPFGETFDVVMCISGLHHVVELEKVLGFVRQVLEDDGEFWSIGEAIGRRGNRLFEEDYTVANQLFRSLPDRLRRNRLSGKVDQDLPNIDYSESTFEGIRSDEIEPLLATWFEPLHVYRRNCFLWRMVDLAYTDNYRLDSPEDLAIIHRLVDAELDHFKHLGSPTELHGAYRKRLI